MEKSFNCSSVEFCKYENVFEFSSTKVYIKEKQSQVFEISLWIVFN